MDKKKELMKDIIVSTAKIGIEDMSNASHRFLWDIFLTKDFDQIDKVKNLLDFLEESAKIVPKDVSQEVINGIFMTLESKLKTEAKEEKEEPKEDIKVEKKTKIFKVDNEEEFMQAIDEIIKDMKESMKDGD